MKSLKPLLLLWLCACQARPSEPQLEAGVCLDRHSLWITLTAPACPPLPVGEDFRVEGQAPVRASWIRETSWADPVSGALQVRLKGYLRMGQPMEARSKLRVEWKGQSIFASSSAERVSPLFHVNRWGYDPEGLKEAYLGLYLGEAGELELGSLPDYTILRLPSRKAVARGQLEPCPEQGWPYQPAPNQKVWRVPMHSLEEGRYCLQVESFGCSPEFRVASGRARDCARLYALGLYHQRCGQALTAPWTEQPRPACHLGPVSPLEVAVVGGHHDAGDYGRYVYNSSLFVHYCLFALEHLGAPLHTDDLGLPESADAIPDLLQLALLELDVLSALQDSEGIFYSRLRPRDRAYDADRPAHQADPQRVSAGNSVSTAAAVAALAQFAGNPQARTHYPERVRQAEEQALRGWSALKRLAYQKSDHHYGQTFEDRDERLWAAVELYRLTGRREFAQAFAEELSGFQGRYRHWGWWAAHEALGCAARSAVFSPKGFPSATLAILRGELLAAGDYATRSSLASAYGCSFPLDSRRNQRAGWFFPQDFSLDVLVAHHLQPQEGKYRWALWRNWNYELGVNPQDRIFITGAGPSSPRFPLHQHASQDDYPLPPPGIPVGGIVSGPKNRPELAEIDHPPLLPGGGGKPLDQRWSDSANVLSEATILQQIRGLIVHCALSTPRREGDRL